MYGNTSYLNIRNKKFQGKKTTIQKKVISKNPSLRKKMQNCALFVVSKDDYQCTDEDEKKLAPERWWLNAKIKPIDNTISMTCDTDEDLLWRAINGKVDKNGCNQILVSGTGGSGKSNLLQRFKAHCPCFSSVTPKGAKLIAEVIASAATGIAAQNVDGETLHRALSLGLADEPPQALFRKISASRFKFQKTWNFLLYTKVLIIDEISMVQPDLFQTLDVLFRLARKNNYCFGGVTLIMFGDFLQLPPVNKNARENSARFVFQTQVWKDMNKCRIYLNRNYRQKDKDFIQLLDEVRFGKLSSKSLALLQSRLVSKLPKMVNEIGDSKVPQILPMSVFSYKTQVEKNNNTRIQQLIDKSGTALERFTPRYRVAPRHDDKEMNAKEAHQGKESFLNVKQTEDRFPIITLEVSIGSQVMMRCNVYYALGVVNGTMGIVTHIGSDAIGVLFLVKSKFLDKPIDVTRHSFRSKFSESVDLIMDQFPISLAWSSTIHKVQGLTLDKLSISGKDCFETGQCYVALSRVRNLEDLVLLDFHPSCIKTDPAAIKFESVLDLLEASDSEDLQGPEDQEEQQEGPNEDELNAEQELEEEEKSAKRFRFL